jgi:hypothetical protein
MGVGSGLSAAGGAATAARAGWERGSGRALAGSSTAAGVAAELDTSTGAGVAGAATADAGAADELARS